MNVRRGEIYFVRLDPTRGHEMDGGKSRPVAVLSINLINQKPLVITIVPGTTKPPTGPFKNVVDIHPSSRNGLAHATYFQCHQIRAIDHSRIIKPPAGLLDPVDIIRLEESLRFCIGL